MSEDWAHLVSFEDAEIDRERGVIVEEWRLRRGAAARLSDVAVPTLLKGSRHADRLPIGSPESVQRVSHDRLRQFYTDWYRPDLMAVLVVGDMDPAEAEAQIKKHFEKLKNPSSPRQRALADVPERKKSEGVVVTDKEATNHVVEIYYTYKKSKEEITVQDYRDYLVRVLFTSMLGQRMQELTQKAEPPFVFGGSNISGWARGYESYQSFAYLGKGGVEPAINALVQENERARKFGFTASELDRVKKQLMKRPAGILTG